MPIQDSPGEGSAPPACRYSKLDNVRPREGGKGAHAKAVALPDPRALSSPKAPDPSMPKGRYLLVPTSILQGVRVEDLD